MKVQKIILYYIHNEVKTQLLKNHMCSSSSSTLSLFKHPPLQTQTLLQNISTFQQPQAAEQPFVQLQKIIFKMFCGAGGVFVPFRHFSCTKIFAVEPIFSTVRHFTEIDDSCNLFCSQLLVCPCDFFIAEKIVHREDKHLHRNFS